MPILAQVLPHWGPALSVGLCLLAIPLIALTRRRPNLREGVSMAIAVLNFAVVASLHAAHQASGGEVIACTLVTLAPEMVVGES